MPVSIVALGPVARRSFWTLGKVALLAVGAPRERAHQTCHGRQPLAGSCRKRGAHGLVLEEMSVNAASDRMNFVTNRKDNKSVTYGVGGMQGFR